MDAALAALLASRSGALASGLEAALLAQGAPHYREAAADERRARVEQLVVALLDHKERAEARALSLEHRLAEIFKGTQSPPEGEA
jgi:hypothetical protein